jgi:predicted acylesterase/phospholipase RssA
MSLFRHPVNLLPAVLLFALAFAAPAASAQKKCIALVLSGVGARGLAQIGTILALEQQGLKPDAIVGTSMGAIIGSLYAAGYSPDSILRFAKALDWSSIYVNSVPRKELLMSQKDAAGNYLFEVRFDKNLAMLLPQSISDGQVFYNILGPRFASVQYLAGKDFDSLPIPLRIVSTNILTGTRVIFSRGDLATAVRASCGFPLIFSPVKIDTMLLMDGGLLSNIPVETCREQFPGYAVIAVDVTSPLWNRQELDNPVRLMDQVVNIGLTKQKAAERALASAVITPDLAGYANTDFSHIDTLVARGYAATMQRMADIRAAISADTGASVPERCSTDALALPLRFRAVPPATAAALSAALTEAPGPLTRDEFRKTALRILSENGYPFARMHFSPAIDSGTIVTFSPATVRGFEVHGNSVSRLSTVKSMLGIRVGDTITTHALSKAISALYASGLFKNVEATPDSNGVVEVSLSEKEFWRARVGLRFDEYHLLEGYIQPAYENLFGLGILTTLHIQYGLLREKYALALQQSHVFSSAFANMVQVQGYISREGVVTRNEYRDTLDSTITRVKLDEQTLVRGGVLALVGMQLDRFLMLEGGVRAEKFSVYESSGLKNPFGGFEKGMQYLMVRLTGDDLDRFPFPEKGQKTYITLGVAHDVVTGTETFAKLDGGTTPCFTVAKIHTFSPQLHFVWASDSMPNVEKVYLGGTVPEEQFKDIDVYNCLPFFGLRQRTLPGDIALLLRGNYRLQIQQGLYFLCSIDWGYAWPWDDRWKLDKLASGSIGVLGREFLNDAPVGMGLGIAWITPVGPLRFSWGRLLRNNLNPDLNILSENLFYLSAGHDF